MSSHRSGALKRSVMSALAAVLAAAVPSLWESPALAEKPQKPASTGSADAPGKDSPVKEKEGAKPNRTKKPHTPRKALAKTEGVASLEVPAKPEKAKAEAKPGEQARHAAGKSAGKRLKKTASRDPAGAQKTARKAEMEAPKRRCTGAPVTIDRSGLERQTLTLVDCHERPVDSAREALSVLARPWGAAKPVERAPRLQLHALAHGAHQRPVPPMGPGELAPGIHLLDRGLLLRVDAVSRRFPGRPISLVSGYRPQSRGSLHQAARALDLRVAGVANEELVAFCKTLPDTGCGYYPNSSFVHMDVRGHGTGAVTWIDASGPGQAPHYVASWPPPPEQADQAVLPPDASSDPYADDPADEHAPDREPSP
jgi:Bacterial protein of unknown function (DUF882)